MAEKDPNSPETTSAAYDLMSPRWHVIDTLLGGTEAMREAGDVYLPQHEEETNDRYQERLQTATLLNMVEQTLNTLSGKPFSDPVKVNEDVPTAIQDQIVPDVDLQGNSLSVFCKQWFRTGLAKSFAHVLVDYPRLQPKEDGKPRTLDDDRKEGNRPYWVLYHPERLLFARAEVINGVEVLQHVRLLETYTVQDGFAEVEKVRIRVLEPGWVQIWEPTGRKKNGKDEWVMTDDWPTGMDKIPLVTFYANRTGFMVGKPPLLDLAWLNVTHWQSSADQRHILTVGRFPILACSGASAEDSAPVVVGPNKVLYNPDPQGKFYYVEHTGAAIAAGDKDLSNLEEQMAGYGAEFLKSRPGDQTATARALDSAESSSGLAAMVGQFEDAVAQVLSLTAEWMRIGDDGGTVELVKDYDELEEPGNLEALRAAREKRDISRKTYLDGLKLRGVLPDDFDPDADWEDLQDEISDLMSKTGLDLDPAQKEGDDEGTKEPGPTGDE